jgi:hypothetical protein
MKLPGWSHIAGSVWQHKNGTRIHTLGMVWLPDGFHYWINTWPQSVEGWRCVRICGGNMRRGLMLWAQKLWQRRVAEMWKIQCGGES